MSNAVFVSYASEDGEAAERIARALRASAIEVWFDKSELRGGDAWDRRIRDQIRTCGLFIPLISTHTEIRDEGYFRREWKLAVERTQDMADTKTFLLPVVIDNTPEKGAAVPERFRQVQWSHLRGGEPSDAFVAHVAALLGGGRSATPAPLVRPAVAELRLGSRESVRWLRIGIVGAAAVGCILWLARWVTHEHAISPTPAAPAQPTFSPPPHSIAVLPFVNLSGDPQQEYFSDGISEELINALSHFDPLQVVARTSSFSFKRQNVDIPTIARKLGVGAILEGSVRRSEGKVRITVQLINAVNGFHIWSENYDRDLRNVLALQTEIATTVATRLTDRLLGDEANKIELGGTHDPEAYDAYLRGQQLKSKAGSSLDEIGYRAALAQFDRAIGLDPGYALAYNAKAATLGTFAVFLSETADEQLKFGAQARTAAERAIELAPELAEAHLALGQVLAYTFLNFTAAAPEFNRAIELSPGSAKVQSAYGAFAAQLGHIDTAVAASSKAVRLDPQNVGILVAHGQTLRLVRHYDDSVVALRHASALDPESEFIKVNIALALMPLGEAEQARQLCASLSAHKGRARHFCLALADHILGRDADAEHEFEQYKALTKNAAAGEYAGIYAAWGRKEEALHWLAIAVGQHDAALQGVKGWWEFDSIRDDPQFKAIVSRLNFPPQ